MSKVYVEKVTANNELSEDGDTRWILLEVHTSDGRVQGMAFAAPAEEQFTVAEIAEGFRDFGMELEGRVDNPTTNKAEPFKVHNVLVTG